MSNSSVFTSTMEKILNSTELCMRPYVTWSHTFRSFILTILAFLDRSNKRLALHILKLLVCALARKFVMYQDTYIFARMHVCAVSSYFYTFFSYWPGVSSTSNFQSMCLHEMIRIFRTEKKSCLQFINSPSSSRDDHKTVWTKEEKVTIDHLLWSCRSTLKWTICVCSSCFPPSSSLWTRCFVPVASKFSCLITIHTFLTCFHQGRISAACSYNRR